MLIGLAAIVLGAAVAGVLLLRDGDDANPPGAAGSTPVKLAGVGAHDPDGGDGEHDSEAPLAVDGRQDTYWKTSSYRASLSAIGKSGVGVVLDAGGPRQLEELTVTTDTPGFAGEIKAGDSPEGPFETVSESKTVGATTTWELDGPEAQYYVVWITDLGGHSQPHVNEVSAS
jgi:hypothetical protein